MNALLRRILDVLVAANARRAEVPGWVAGAPVWVVDQVPDRVSAAGDQELVQGQVLVAWAQAEGTYRIRRTGRLLPPPGPVVHSRDTVSYDPPFKNERCEHSQKQTQQEQQQQRPD